MRKLFIRGLVYNSNGVIKKLIFFYYTIKKKKKLINKKF